VRKPGTLRGVLLILPAALMLAANASLPPPAAKVADHAVEWRGPPQLRIRVPAKARYLGGERFVLFDVADCEIHLFVEAGPDRLVRRYYWIQREAFLPDQPTRTHDYAGNKDRREDHWGLGLWVRPRFGPTGMGEKPGSDGAHIRDLVARAGYRLPPEMMNVRLVRLLDEKGADGHGREELMIIYAEDMALSGVSVADLEHGQTIDPRWDAMGKALTERAVERMKVAVGGSE